MTEWIDALIGVAETDLRAGMPERAAAAARSAATLAAQSDYAWGMTAAEAVRVAVDGSQTSADDGPPTG